MAKQTFTTGQVLTAAQMTSLQQTAMGGGSATAKTASYVLVAADAGTTVIMNSASSTTITVNTGLFAAGDTVLIQNIGAGTCTITAGTATVSTAGSLALTQYEAGILYFTATGTALLHDFVQASSNPLTTTGDMIYSSSGSTQARLAIGSTSQVLTVSGGIPSWATPSSGSMTLINTGGTALTGTSITLSSIPQTYEHLQLIIINKGGAIDEMTLRINGDSATRYVLNMGFSVSGTGGFSESKFRILDVNNTTNTNNISVNFLPNYTNTTTYKMCSTMAVAPDFSTITDYRGGQSLGAYNQTSAITSLVIGCTGGFTAGTAYLYGVK